MDWSLIKKIRSLEFNMEESVLKSILSRKLSNCSEIELHLFEFCNLNCSFCGQDHNSKVGFETIQEKALDAMAFMHKSHHSAHIINIMGGEIFNDEIPDDLFKEYLAFGNSIIEYASQNNQKIILNWVTNLIFKRKERVFELLNSLQGRGVEVNISTSYDFDGRGYAGKVNSIFARNIREFKEYIYTVGFVLTAPAIKNYLNHSDDFFHELYKNYTLFFDYYVPEEKNSDKLMPSDHDLYEAFVYTATHYPNIYPVKDWLENKENKMTCYSLNKLTILPNGNHVTCRYLNYGKNAFKNPIDYNSNANIVSSFIQEHECLSCQWYDRCSMRCFVQADWAKREKMQTCLYKKFFDEIVIDI